MLKLENLAKQMKSSEDVQVFTSLPPNVEGEIKFYLKLEIIKINLIQDTGKPKTADKQTSKYPSSVNESAIETNLIARCVWWGEENSNGSIFRPKVLVNNKLNSGNLNGAHKIQTNAKYVVRSGHRQFTAYLNGFNHLSSRLFEYSTKL